MSHSSLFISLVSIRFKDEIVPRIRQTCMKRHHLPLDIECLFAQVNFLIYDWLVYWKFKRVQASELFYTIFLFKLFRRIFLFKLLVNIA